MTRPTFQNTDPAHRLLWSGLSSDDPAAEVGVLGVPFDNATSFRKGAAFAPARVIYEVFGWVKE
jgi:arginase family enzyme